MSAEQLVFLAAAVAIVAFLYSSVGHAGASGYIAVMTLFGLAPAAIKPTALVLNILVASITTWQFWRAGHFSWKLFWPFAVLSVPLAFVGGYLNLPTHIFKVLVGVVLLLSATRFFINPSNADVAGEPPLQVVHVTEPSVPTKTVAAVSALFILVNSIAGLLGNFSSTWRFPSFAIPLLLAALIGGSLGSYLGSQRFPHTVIKRLLAVVLVIAGVKLILT